MGCLHARQPYAIGRATISRRRKVGLGTPEEGWGDQMQEMQVGGMQVCQGRLLMQLLMQITTALYLAITLASFDASSLFQTWQNQRERGELRYIQPPKITRQVFGLLFLNVEKQPIPLCLSVRKCDCDREVGSGSKWVLRLWSEWRHLDHVWPHGGNGRPMWTQTGKNS